MGAQDDVSLCRLQGFFFFPSCSVQPLQSAVTQPETARCTLQTGHKRSQNKAWTRSQPGEKRHVKESRILLSARPSAARRALRFNPGFPGVALETKVELFHYLRG